MDPITAVKVACHNAARYFLLNNRGAIAPGYLGDFVIIDSFQDFHIEKVFKKGELMVDHGVVRDFPAPPIDPYLTERAHSTFHVQHLTAEDFTEYPASTVVISPFTMLMMPRGRASVKSCAVRCSTWKVLWARSVR